MMRQAHLLLKQRDVLIASEVHEASLAWSELEGCISELTEDARVTLEKAMEEYKKFEAFNDEVIEGALDMFFFGFDECKK